MSVTDLGLALLLVANITVLTCILVTIVAGWAVTGFKLLIHIHRHAYQGQTLFLMCAVILKFVIYRFWTRIVHVHVSAEMRLIRLLLPHFTP